MQQYVSSANDGKDIFAMLVFIERGSKYVGLYDLLYDKSQEKMNS
jgi:hypothetical protein